MSARGAGSASVELPPVPWVLAGVVASTALRWRTLQVALTSDEGGFLAIARAWSRGATLYRDVWVDRPQGLILLYRLCRFLGGDGPVGVRVMAMVAAAVVVAATATVAAATAGRRAGACAAVLVGVTISSPGIEGHIANGELLSGAFVAAGLAVGCLAIGGRRSWQWFVAAGVLSGIALTVKQSGFDGLIALLACLVLGLALRRWTWREAGRWAGWIGAGTAGPLVLVAVHGAITGWSRWWYAVVGYRLDSRSAFTGSNWSHLQTTLGPAVKVLGAPAAVAALAVLVPLVPAVRPHLGSTGRGTPAGPVRMVLVAWPVAAAGAFIAGGLFHLHYWVLLCAPLSAACAAVIANRLDGRRAALAVAVACIVPIGASIDVLRHRLDQIPAIASADPRGPIDQAVAAWYRAHARPGDRMWVMCASAGFYAAAGEDPPYPYLWLDNIGDVPGARAALRSLVAGDHAPRWIAVYQFAGSCDPSGTLGHTIDARYRSVDHVGVVDVLELGATGDAPGG